MAQQARITSVDELESFRSAMIIFMNKASRAVDQVGDEVKRSRYWLVNDRVPFWQMQIKKRQKVLDQANQELLSARNSEFRDSLAVQQMAVRKAKGAVKEAEDKLDVLKGWCRRYDHETDPRVRKLESLRHFIDNDLPKGIAYLTQAIRTLESYAERSAPAEAPPPPSELPPSL